MNLLPGSVIRRLFRLWLDTVQLSKVMVFALIVLTVLVLSWPGNIWGANDIVMVDMNASAAAAVELTITPRTVNFPDADPDFNPTINAMENPVMVTISTNAGKTKRVLLTAQAQGDLVSGSDTIPITKIRWTATGPGFVPGTMSRTSAVTAGTWVGSGVHSGTFSYFLTNSWQYARGNYHASVIYTLSIP